MKNFKPSKMLIRTFIMTLLSLFLLVGVSFAWYYSKISIGGGGLSTGTIGCIVYGYDATGTLKSTVTSSGDNTTVNTTIFAHEDWKAGDASTAYIAVKRTGSIDIEFNVSFSASGYNGALENFMYLGGYWYEISEITDVMSAKTDTALKTYASKNKVVLCSESQCPNNKHTCTEKDGVGNYKNMNTILTTKTQGVIKTTGDQIRYYRIDYGVRKDATPEEYTNKKIELTANVYVTQVGAIQNPDGVGVEYTVSTEAQLRQAIIDSVPGDTIIFASNITYTGDLTINKALNLNLASKTLTVKGNLTYNFTSAHTMKINLSGAGTIKVLMNGQGGGNFTLDTPNAQVEIVGTNTNGDLIVERICTLSGSNNPEKGGCVLSGVTIKDTVNESKEVYLKSDSKVTVSDGSTVKRLEARSQASNIQIVNNGVIESINLGSMFYSDMTDFPQVYIINHGLINGLVLPTWSEVFKEINGIYSGNTKIVCTSGGVINNLTEVNGFKNSHIVYEGSTILVESIDGTHERLRVNYKNKAATTTTLEGLLREYFTSEGYASNAISGCIAKITYLEIVMLSGKYLTTDDSTFLKGSSFNKLESLNLENANLSNNTLTSNFLAISSLKELILPKNLQIIESTPFGTVAKINSIIVPESVTSIKTKGLLGVRYAYFQSVNVPSVVIPSSTNDMKNMLGCTHVFAPEAIASKYEYNFNKDKEPDNTFYIAEQEALGNTVSANNFLWGTLKVPVYPACTLADDGVSFVKKLSDGTYELVLLDLGNNPDVIVDNKYVVGKNVTVNNEPIVISRLGRYALSKNEYKNLEISFDYSITVCGRKSVSDADFYTLDFSNIQEFDRATAIYSEIEHMKFSNTNKITTMYAFLQTYAKHVDLGSVTRIEGQYAFQESRMYELDLGNVTYVNSSGFNRCDKLKKVVSSKLIELRSKIFDRCTSLTEVSFTNIEIMSNNIFIDCNNLVYLNLGNKLKTVDAETLAKTPRLKYLYIGSTNSNITKFNRLKTENPKIDYIFVAPSLYDTFYSNVYSTMKESLREYGVSVGDYEISGNISDTNPYPITVGDYTVRTTSGGVIITSCNYRAEDFPADYQIPATLNVNGTTYNVIGIGKRAFAYTNAAPISFNNVTTIDSYAFYDCDKLQNVNAPNLTTANTYAFAECDKLTSVIIPNATSWGTYLFYNCPSLTSIYMEKSLATSNANCISGTTTNVKTITITLDSATVATATPFAGIASKSVDLYVLTTRLSVYTGNSTFSKFNVVGIDKIETSNFSKYCLKVTTGTNYEIISISVGASTLVIPNNKGIVSSKQGVFDSLAVTSITLPNTYKSVVEGEFSNVIGLQQILVDSGNTNYVSVGGVLYAKSTAGNKRELICYPNSKTGDSYTTESDTTVLSNSAFKNVKYLKTLNVTANVSAIGEACFKNSSMSSITFTSTTAPYITSSNVFNTSVTGFKIYVPSDSYKTANGFSKYVEYIVVQ